MNFVNYDNFVNYRPTSDFLRFRDLDEFIEYACRIHE